MADAAAVDVINDAVDVVRDGVTDAVAVVGSVDECPKDY